MPTLEHNAIVSLFRDNPPLAPHLVETLFGMAIPAHASVAVVESSLDEMVPIEFRADLVLELRDKLGGRVMSVILEVQRDIDRKKERSWPVYAAVERARKDCPSIVLVVATDANVADWAAKPIDLGLSLHVMRPLVLGPKVVPVVTDPTLADNEPELAILSALAHADGPQAIEVVMTALGALVRFDQEHVGPYFHIVYNHLREPLRQAIQELIMQKSTSLLPKLPPVPQDLMDRLARAYEIKFRQEGQQEGELKGLRDALLRMLNRANIDISEDQRAQVRSCTSIETLERWLDNVIGAKTAADVFK